MKSISSIGLILIFCLVLQACDKPDCGCAPPLSTNLVGKWEWVRTIDESGEVITPQTLGYGRSMSLGNSDKVGGDYLYLAENEKQVKVLRWNTPFGKVESSKDTLKIFSQFGNEYVKFFLLKNSNNVYPELIRTDLVDDYSKGFGGSRHYYKKVGIPDKP